MAENKNNLFNEPQESPALVEERISSLRLGLVSNDDESDETRFFLTPEACGMVTSMGYEILMQSGASIDISYTDDDYLKNNVRIVGRDEALQSDIVLSVRPLSCEDVVKMKSGATLLCLF